MTTALCGPLGYEPTTEPLSLTTGATFVQNIVPSGTGVFPSGTTVTLQLSTPGGMSLGNWSATVTPTLASWLVSNTIADLIPANSRYLIMVSYPTSPVTNYAWFAGVVKRTAAL